MSRRDPIRHRRKVSILYFRGCPNHRPTVDMVRAVVAEFDLDAEVEEVDLTNPDDAGRLRFLGSPTVQVDGVDIEAAARSRTDYAMSCRLYKTPDGIPSRGMLLTALGVAPSSPAGEPGVRSGAGGVARVNDPTCCCGTDAAPGEDAPPRRSHGVAGGLIASGGSLVSAMMSSACCWGPLLLVAFGASAAGFSPIFGPWRPVFVVLAVTMLALSFYLTFIRKPVGAARCCAQRGRPGGQIGRVTWYLSALLVGAFVLFPQYVGLALGGSSATSAAPAPDSQSRSREFSFRVEGMHCEACAVALKAELAKIDGVQHVQVDYASRTARIAASDNSVVPRVVKATERAGFIATPQR